MKKAAAERPRWRRWLRAVAWTAGGLIGLLVVAILALLYSSTVARVVVGRGLAAYAEAIPGDVSVERIEGRLGGDLVLHGVRLEDRDGTVLVEADRLRLGVDLPAAMTGRLDLGTLELEGVRVTLPAAGAPGFGDLAPPSEEEPPTDDDALGPDLPLRIDAALALHDFVLLDGETGTELVTIAVLELDAWGQGRRAAAGLRLDAAAPVVDLEDVQLAMRAEWNEPQVRVIDLDLRSSWGTVLLPEARLDAEHMRGALEPATIEASPTWVESQLGIETTDPWRLAVHGEGDPEHVEIQLELEAPERLSARATISGRPFPPLDTRVELRLVPGPALLREVAELEHTDPPELLLTATVEGDPQGELSTQLMATCSGCDPQGAPVTLALRAKGAPSVPRGQIRSTFAGGGVHLELDGSLAPGGQIHGTAELAAPDLGDVARVAGRFVALPELAGEASARLDCGGTIDPLAVGCAIELGVREGKPVHFVDIAAHVAIADAIEIVAERLRVDAPPVRLGLASGTPRVVLEGDAIRIDDVDVRVAVGKAVGRVVASGRIDDAEGHVLDVGVRGLELEGLDSIVPGLGLRGRLDLEAHLTGTTSAPKLDASVRARNLGWQAHDLGSLHADLGVREGVARVGVRSPTGPFRGLHVDAQLPLHSSADGLPTGLRGHAPARATIRLEDFDLAIAAGFATDPLPLAGRLDIDAALRGTLARPRLELTLAGRELAFDGTGLGDLHALLSYAPSLAHGEIALSHPSVRTAKVEVDAALGIDLATPRVTWSPSHAHGLRLTLEDAQLGALAPWLPEPALGGSLDLEATLAGSLDAPRLDAHLGLRDLEVSGRPVGSIEADMGYAEDAAWMRATGRGSGLEGLGLTARVPMRVSAAGVEWRANDPHEIDVALVGAHLGDLVAWLPEPLDLEGRGDTYLRVRGTAKKPEVETTLAFDGLRYGGRHVGQLALDASFLDELATVELELRHDARRNLVAEASVPLRVDALEGEAQWLSDRPHALRVVAPHIDPLLLEPFVELPESLGFALALKVEGEGTLEAPVLDARFDGHVELEGSPRQPLSTQLAFGSATQRARVVLGSAARPLLEVDGRIELPLAAAARGEAQVTDAPLHVDLRADLDLALADGLAPALVANPSGRLDLRASIDGSVGSPMLDGSLHVRDASMTVVPLRQRFESVALEVGLTRDRIELSSLTARSGRGSVRASGHLELEASGPSGELVLQGRRVPVRKPGLPHMELTTDIRTTVSHAGEATRIGVDVRKTRVDVTLAQTSAAKPIPTSPRVRHVTLAADAAARPALRPIESPIESDEPVESTASASGAPMVVQVELVDPVRITGPSVDMAWDGKIQATLGDEVETDGALSTKDGFFDLFGNQFRIEEGSVFIPAGRDGEPFVDLTATTQVAEVEITAHVRGRVSRPELVFSSTPAMTQSQIFTMLLTGSPDVDGADGGDVEARAASLLAAFSNPALQRQLNERLRVDRIGVGFGERTDQPILSAGKYLGKKVYVETQYRHNASPNENRAQLMMRYRVAPRWSLETVFGDAAAGGIDLFWGRAFDTPIKNPDKEPR